MVYELRDLLTQVEVEGVKVKVKFKAEVILGVKSLEWFAVVVVFILRFFLLILIGIHRFKSSLYKVKVKSDKVGFYLDLI